jgi:uncharacterized protein involved in type VI secretion and phage assembly
MAGTETLKRRPTGLSVPTGPWYGVHPATVSDVRDPEGQGRVKLRLPWAEDSGSGTYEVWARVATLMAGNQRGTWFIPDVDDEVLVAFQAGDPRHPYVVGALWNGRDRPPEAMDRNGRNARKVIHSRNGVRIALEDVDGKERFVVETPGGQRLLLEDGPRRVRVEDGNGNVVSLEPGGVVVKSAAKVKVAASAVEIAADTVTVKAKTSKFTGVVQADAVITKSVVSASYSPGAGNRM